MAAIREVANLDEWMTEWKCLEDEVSKLKTNEYQKVLKAQDEYQSAQGALQKALDAHNKKFLAFNESLKRLSRSTQSKGSDETIGVVTAQMNSMTKKISEMQQGLPKKPGWFLRACLGNIDVSLNWDKLNYKNEYEKFKLRMTVISMAFVLVNILFLPYRLTDALFHGVLVWYYSSLTLQEHILIANGSRIRGWWVVHHYLSILLSGFILTWPDSKSYQLFRSKFYWFSLYLSFVQFLQYYYQRGVLYRLRALGFSSNMDVTVEGFRSWMFKGLSFLVPFLVIGYAFQIYNAGFLYRLSSRPECKEWHVAAAGILFLILGVGNMLTLVRVMRQKSTTVVRLPCG